MQFSVLLKLSMTYSVNGLFSNWPLAVLGQNNQNVVLSVNKGKEKKR